MSIKSRIQKAKEQASLVVSRKYNSNKFTRHYGMRSLSNQANYYYVDIVFRGKDKIEDVEFLTANATCKTDKDRIGTDLCDCKGNSQTVCYHVMAGIITGANNAGKKAIFFDNFSEAFNYSKLGGQLLKVQSTQGDKGYGWAVIK